LHHEFRAQSDDTEYAQCRGRVLLTMLESLIIDMRNYIENSDEYRCRPLRLLETVTLYIIYIYSCIVMGKMFALRPCPQRRHGGMTSKARTDKLYLGNGEASHRSWTNLWPRQWPALCTDGQFRDAKMACVP